MTTVGTMTSHTTRYFILIWIREYEVTRDSIILVQVEYYYDDSDEDPDIDYSRKPVPILLSIVLVVAYIIGGAFLFQMWEGWSFLDSSYFCFITLTTIGFGDLTPDQRNAADGEQVMMSHLRILSRYAS